MANKNLVILRAGDSSLHTNWINYANRNWDLIISYYGDKEIPFEENYIYLQRSKGSKWQGLSSCIEEKFDLIEKYNLIWLPDDDLMTSCDDVNQFFNTMESLQFDIAQPALTLTSYFSHQITRRHPLYTARATNFVEIMAPCFRIRALKLLRSTFSENVSGWGLEWLWHQKIKDKGWQQGIIDTTPITHTRPVGSADRGLNGKSPFEEQSELFQKYNIEDSTPKTDFYIARWPLPPFISEWVHDRLLNLYRPNKRHT